MIGHDEIILLVLFDFELVFVVTLTFAFFSFIFDVYSEFRGHYCGYVSHFTTQIFYSLHVSIGLITISAI